MHLPHREHSYDWVDGWAKSPDSESARSGWAHHDVVVSSTGDVITFHQADPTVLIFASDGSYKDSWEAPVSNSHGMEIVMENEEEFLWLADKAFGPSRWFVFPLDTAGARCERKSAPRPHR